MKKKKKMGAKKERVLFVFKTSIFISVKYFKDDDSC